VPADEVVQLLLVLEQLVNVQDLQLDIFDRIVLN